MLDPTARVKSIISENLGLTDIDVAKLIRLYHGRSAGHSEEGNKPRPVKVVLGSVDQSRNVLKKAPCLRAADPPNNRIFIGPDLNKTDRDNNDKLIAELKKIRVESAAKGENCKWGIRRNKIVKFPTNLATPTDNSTQAT